MTLQRIKKISFFVCLLLTTIPLSPSAQGRNEYARNPLTPGYGISDYFELMPDKVEIIGTRKADAAIRHTPVVSASILRGRTLIIQADGVHSASNFTVAIHTPAGRRVWVKDGLSLRSGNQLLTFTIPHPLPNGVYFISIAGSGVERRTMKVVTVR
jgi:hypothetical protein